MSTTMTHHDDTLATLAEAPTSRRAFLRSASLTAVGGALVACGTGSEKNAASAQKAPIPAATPTVATTVAQTGGTMGAHDTAKSTTAAVSASDTMDAMHEKGSRRFPPRPPSTATSSSPRRS